MNFGDIIIFISLYNRQKFISGLSSAQSTTSVSEAVKSIKIVSGLSSAQSTTSGSESVTSTKIISGLSSAQSTTSVSETVKSTKIISGLSSPQITTSGSETVKSTKIISGLSSAQSTTSETETVKSTKSPSVFSRLGAKVDVSTSASTLVAATKSNNGIDLTNQIKVEKAASLPSSTPSSRLTASLLSRLTNTKAITEVDTKKGIVKDHGGNLWIGTNKKPRIENSSTSPVVMSVGTPATDRGTMSVRSSIAQATTSVSQQVSLAASGSQH